MISKRLIFITLFAIILGQTALMTYQYRWRIYNYFQRHNYVKNAEYDKFFAQWKVYGIDVSEYQGRINWQEVSTIFGEHKIHFAFIRATAGKDKVDSKFKRNWNAKKIHAYCKALIIIIALMKTLLPKLIILLPQSGLKKATCLLYWTSKEFLVFSP